MSKYLDTTKLSIREIDRKLARDMIVKNHYSQKWTKCSVALGLYYSDGTQHKFFDMEDEKLIGVICYGDPIGRHSGASISTEIPRENVYELVRLFIHDGYGSNIESYLIGQGFKWLKENQPHIKALISYADPQAGHVGTIYQATNWIYQGNKIRPNDSWLYKWEEEGEWLQRTRRKLENSIEEVATLAQEIGETPAPRSPRLRAGPALAGAPAVQSRRGREAPNVELEQGKSSAAGVITQAPSPSCSQQCT